MIISWKDKEPLVIQAGPGGTRVLTGSGASPAAGATGAGGHGGPPPGAPQKMSPEEMAKFEKDLDARRAEAEANRRVVEYRIYYGDYQPVGGVKLPHRIQRSIDGKTTEEMVFESFKVNSKIDQSTFKTSK